MTCAINWDNIFKAPSLADRATEITRQIDELLAKYGTIPLTECIIYRQRGGQHFIVELDKRQSSTDFGDEGKGRWKLRLLVHPDGTKPKPGDEFRWQVGEVTSFIDEQGNRVPMNTKEKQRRMKFCKKPGDRWDWRKWRTHVLDEDCCFVCNNHDAMALLTNMSELSDYEETGPNNAHYWLVEEVIPQDEPVKKGK